MLLAATVAATELGVPYGQTAGVEDAPRLLAAWAGTLGM
jgi:hypothetical protein